MQRSLPFSALMTLTRVTQIPSEWGLQTPSMNKSFLYKFKRCQGLSVMDPPSCFTGRRTMRSNNQRPSVVMKKQLASNETPSKWQMHLLRCIKPLGFCTRSCCRQLEFLLQSHGLMVNVFISMSFVFNCYHFCFQGLCHQSRHSL